MTNPVELPNELDLLIVTQPENVRYLSGFTAPEDGLVVLAREGATLFTDARYAEQALAESRVPVEIVNPREGYGFLRPHLKGARVGYEARHMPCARKDRIEAETNVALLPTEGVVERARTIKGPDELERIVAAARIADEGYAHLLAQIKPGARELDLALELEFWMRKNGAERAAFDFIVASGPRGALPHGVASTKRLERGELVTFDFGAVVDGYHSDMTRAVALGTVDTEMQRIFEVAEAALEAALEAAGPGVAARQLDAVARGVIERAGYGSRFVHSLGHGVGLEVHEAPFLNARSDEVLEPGMVITLEPGIYLPGKGGVRLEELVHVTPTGIEVLSRAPRGWLEV
ncbi:M24 family metallopeptidase [Oceanithermus sp.]